MFFNLSEFILNPIPVCRIGFLFEYRNSERIASTFFEVESDIHIAMQSIPIVFHINPGSLIHSNNRSLNIDNLIASATLFNSRPNIISYFSCNLPIEIFRSASYIGYAPANYPAQIVLLLRWAVGSQLRYCNVDDGSEKTTTLSPDFLALQLL